MADALLVNILPTAPVHGGDKFRVTWTFRGSSLLPGVFFNAPAAADAVRNWLPSAGFVPVSNPAALPGDESVTFDVRLAQAWGGRIVADFVEPLSDPPTVLLFLSRIVPVPATVSSAQLAKDQAQARADAEAAANTNAVFELAADAGKGLLSGAKWLTLLALIAGVAFIVYKAKQK